MNDPTPMSTERLVALADAYLVGELKPEELAELERALKNSSSSRALFALVTDQAAMMREVFTSKQTAEFQIEQRDTSEFLEVLASLEDHSNSAQIVDLTDELKRRKLEKHQKKAAENRWRLGLNQSDSSPSGLQQYVIPKLVSGLGVAALIGLVAWLGWFRGGTSLPPPQGGGSTHTSVEETDLAPVLATLVRTLDARWADDPGAWDGTTRLREGEHHLAEGLVEIKLTDGTHLVLEAPVLFELTGTNAMKLSRGRLVATVPPAAIGFTIDTPSARIIDYGTEFGVDATAEGITQAHVFRGEISVAALQEAAPPTRLVQGEAGTVSRAGQVESIAVEPLAFVQEEEFSARVLADESAYHRWLAYRYELLRDPALVAFFVADEDTVRERRIRNHAENSASPDDASVHNLALGEGRFSQRPSLLFKEDQSSARFDFDTPMRSMTLAAWVWIDSIPEFRSGLVMSDDWFRRAGSVHWQLDQDNQGVSFGYSTLAPGNQPRSDSSSTLPLGRWVHVATVVDTDRGIVVTYIDGSRVDALRFEVTKPLILGPTLIGNWTDRNQPGVRRRFDGRMDELVILARAMSDNEVQTMYSQTRHSEAGR